MTAAPPSIAWIRTPRRPAKVTQGLAETNVSRHATRDIVQTRTTSLLCTHAARTASGWGSFLAAVRLHSRVCLMIWNPSHCCSHNHAPFGNSMLVCRRRYTPALSLFLWLDVSRSCCEQPSHAPADSPSSTRRPNARQALSGRPANSRARLDTALEPSTFAAPTCPSPADHASPTTAPQA